MTLFRKTLLAATIGTLFSTSPLYAAEGSESITEALKSGDVKLHLRYRYEDVDEDGKEEATANTLKTRLTYTSGTYNGLGLTVEMDDVTELVDDDYTSIPGDGNGTAIIADPEGTEVNQAYLSYTKSGTTGKWGRQRIILDNQRFVGGVGWRQDEQTFSGLTINSKATEDLTLFYGYITQVNRIFAEEKDHNHDTHLLNAKYNTPIGSITGYGYLIDNQTALALSSDTYGLRWQGKIGNIFSYNLEYATQSEAGDNPTEYSADYMLAEAKADIPIAESKLNLKAGYEVLGSDNGKKAFTTSLATLHAFQGWADKFLGTPDSGIVDTYLSAGAKVGKVKLGLIYHTLAADYGDSDYGTELDFVAKTKVGPVGLTLKYADYSADDHTTDTTKIWLMASATF